jgi:hypothetical protein
MAGFFVFRLCCLEQIWSNTSQFPTARSRAIQHNRTL